MSSQSTSRPVISNTFFRSSYSPKTRVSITFPSDSPFTKQSFKDECDINILMRKYQSTGEIPVMNQRAPQYLDVTGADYQAAMEFVAGANTLFHEMPSAIRSRFDNDPAAFLDFCSQEKNRLEMAQMGLLNPEAAEAILNPKPVAPAAPVVAPVVEEPSA